jgi:cytochrome c peroxidase
MRKLTVISIIVLVLLWACKKEVEENYTTIPYATPYISNFRPFPENIANPLTEEGVSLGHKLFFDPILSRDNTLACAGCHNPEHGFSDPRRVSLGVGGTPGIRQAMPIINMAWHTRFFWDGRDSTLQNQAIRPVQDSIEMHLPWEQALVRLNSNSMYKNLFKNAFNVQTITQSEVLKALEQYEKALIVYNSPFDKYQRKEASLSESALRGMQIFNTEKGDCFHCHTTQPSETFVVPTKVFANNGLDEYENAEDFPDKGLGATTGILTDYGKFKIPSLRNLTFTAPYMHDGRFATLDDVIDNYDLGPKQSPSLEPVMLADANKRVLLYGRYGLGLTAQDKEDLKAFLRSLTDSSVLTNPLFQRPNF